MYNTEYVDKILSYCQILIMLTKTDHVDNYLFAESVETHTNNQLHISVTSYSSYSKLPGPTISTGRCQILPLRAHWSVNHGKFLADGATNKFNYKRMSSDITRLFSLQIWQEVKKFAISSFDTIFGIQTSDQGSKACPSYKWQVDEVNTYFDGHRLANNDIDADKNPPRN